MEELEVIQGFIHQQQWFSTDCQLRLNIWSKCLGKGKEKARNSGVYLLTTHAQIYAFSLFSCLDVCAADLSTVMYVCVL